MKRGYSCPSAKAVWGQEPSGPLGRKTSHRESADKSARQGPHAVFPVTETWCPKTCLQLKLNAWNVRLEAILCYFFLLKNRADCQRRQPGFPPHTSCLCSENSTGSGFAAL